MKDPEIMIMHNKFRAMCMNLSLPSSDTLNRGLSEWKCLESGKLFGTKGFGDGGNCERESSVYNIN
jgi:hypothetical protein